MEIMWELEIIGKHEVDDVKPMIKEWNQYVIQGFFLLLL